MKIHHHTEKWFYHYKDVYILIDEGYVLGHAYVETLEDCHILGGLYVLPEFRGHNYGKIIIESILSDKKYDMDIWLAVDHKASTLIQWYETLGFNLEHNKDDDFIWMKFIKLSQNS